MALLVAEGFDDVSNNTAVNSHLGKVYTYSGASITEFQNNGGVWGGRYSHGYAKGMQATNSNMTWSLPSPLTTIFLACAFRRSADFTSDTPRIRFRYNTDSHVDIVFGGTNGADLKVWVAGSPVGSAVTGFWPLNSYKWISVKVVIHATAGLVEIRDNTGALVFTYSGNTVNTGAGAASVNNVHLPSNGPAANNGRIDDLFIMDSTGSSFNGHLTETIIKPLYPNADGDLTAGWTANGASALWDCVDEAFFDGDTTYAAASASGQRLSVNIQDPAGTETGILGVIVNSAVRRDDAGSWSWKNFLRISGTNYDDAPAATSATNSYVHRSSIWYQNPSTSTDWSASDLTNLQIGVVD